MIKRLARILLATAALTGTTLAAEEFVVDIRQGTNIAVALSPDGQTLLTNLLGGLWRLPASGGGAIPLLAAGQDLYQPRFSPNGNSVVMQRYRNGQWDLFVYDLAAERLDALTDTPYDEQHPEFSADGERIVFVSNRSGSYALWALELRTRALNRLTTEPGDSFFPAVSDQGELAYVNTSQGAWTLRLLESGAAGTELLRSQSILSAPSWRPGGGVIVYQERDGVRASRLRMLLLADPHVVKTLTEGEDIFDARPDWLSPSEYLYAADGQIWRRPIAGFDREPVHLFAALSLEVAAPHAREALLDAPGPQPVTGITGLTTMADERLTAFAALGDIWLLDRRTLKRVTDDPYLDIDPSFSPDASKLVFASDRGGSLDLWQISLEDGVPMQLTAENAKAFQPVYGPRGRFVAYLESDGLGPRAQARLRLLDLEGNSETNRLGAPLYDVGRLRWAAVDSEARIVIDARAGSATAPRQTLSFDIGGNLLVGEEVPPAAAPMAVDELPRGAPLEWSNRKPDEPYVIQVGRLFDGVRNTYLRHVDIHVEGQRIVAIVGRGLRPLPDKVMDARDATVIPGMIDARAHQSWLSGERLGRTWLAYGVTSVRELATDLPAAAARAETWASGRQAGPRLFIEPADDAPLDPPAEATAGRLQPTALQRPLALLRLDQAGQSATLTLADRAPSLRDLNSSPLLLSYQDTLGVLIGSRSFVSTALGAAAGMRRGRTDATFRHLFLPHEQLAWQSSAMATAQLAPLQDTLARLVRGGANVAAGSNAPEVPYGYGLHMELQLLVAGGIPADQALRLATARGAMALGLDGQLGTLEDGKLADLVVIDGDPLARISDTLNIGAVVRGGVWFDRAQLLEPLDTAPPTERIAAD